MGDIAFLGALTWGTAHGGHMLFALHRAGRGWCPGDTYRTILLVNSLPSAKGRRGQNELLTLRETRPRELNTAGRGVAGLARFGGSTLAESSWEWIGGDELEGGKAAEKDEREFGIHLAVGT